jgi:8-oxo-dGTP pyrophosphatase MutT (NUDIX family)
MTSKTNPNSPITASQWAKVMRSTVQAEPDIAPEGLRAASVLVPVVMNEDKPKLILTKRTAHLSDHAGQVCFPGGKINAGETVRDAALRESWEEIGLTASAVEMVGYLPSVVAAEQFHIAPVLGFVDPEAELIPEPNEVDLILPLPLDKVLNDKHFRQEPIKNRGRSYLTWVIDHDEEFIWGATAKIIVQWHKILSQLL